MSKNLKGITLDIGGKTDKLINALEDVNKKSKDIENELKEVNKLLKFDPKNSELLAQKQKLLGDAIASNKEKLDTLKTAETKAREEFAKGKISEEQYRALQREIVETEQKLKGLETQAKKANGALSEKQAVQNLKNVGMAAGAAIIAVGVATVKFGADFEEAMAKVSTIADTSEIPLDTLKDSIMALSNQTGISASLIAEDVYNAISAGQSTADAISFVENATKLAKAGFTESGQALDVLTTILNSYGLESSETARISDILIQTQNKGKTTVAELSSTMGKAIPTAKAAGVSIEQLAAGYAIMTSKGIAAAESTTYMNGLFNELSKTGSKTDVALRELTGKSFTQLMESGKSVSDVLEILNNSAVKNGLSLKDMFGSAEAGKAALVLLSDDASTFNNMVVEMKNSTGATDEAFDKVSDTINNRFNIALNSLKNIFVDLFDSIKWIIVALFDFADWMGKNETILIYVGIAMATLVTALIAYNVHAAWGAISTWTLTTATAAWGAAMHFLASPITLTILAIGALIAIGVLLYKNWDTVSAFGKKVWGGIGDFIGGIIDGIGGSMKKMANGVIDALNFLIKGANKLKFDIPDWVPLLGGKKFGLNIPLIPKFEMGTRFLPKDMLVFAHEGEMIVPKKENPYANSGGNVLPQFDIKEMAREIVRGLERANIIAVIDEREFNYKTDQRIINAY